MGAIDIMRVDILGGLLPVGFRIASVVHISVPVYRQSMN